MASSPDLVASEKPDAAIGIDFPPVKDAQDLLQEQQQRLRGAVTQEEVRSSIENDIPPIVRSVLELAHLMMSGHSQKLRAAPGYQGGLFYQGSPFCFASGFRDGNRPLDVDDKGNHMRLKDPLNYGSLSLPIMAAYLCELHSKHTFDINAPLTVYLPELGPNYDILTARSILSFERIVDDRHVLKDVGVTMPLPLLRWNMCAATQKHLHQPIHAFFSGGTKGTVMSGQQQRSNFIQYLRSSRRVRGPIRRPLQQGSISHFSIALLVAAVETQLGGTNFEASIAKGFFERAQSHGAGYGPPKLWRDPNDLFYQPTGQSSQHQGFKKPLPVGALSNCAAPLLNASLNLYAPVEDYGKLVLLSLDTIRRAREVLGKPHVGFPHFDFGVKFVPATNSIHVTKELFPLLDTLPSTASLRYSCEHDLGCFGVSNCGSRSARIFANTLSRMIQHLFVKHVLQTGVDAMQKVDLNNPTKAINETDEKFKKIVKDRELRNYVKTGDAHTRF